MTQGVSGSDTVAQWGNAMRIAHLGHITAAKKDSRRHRVLGGVAVVLAAISATAVFTNIRDNPTLWVQVSAGAVILVSAAVGAVNTFLNYSARAAAHQSAATGYGGLRRELEQRLLMGTVDDTFLTQFRTEWTRLDGEAPTLPPRVYDWAFEKVTGRKP